MVLLSTFRIFAISFCLTPSSSRDSMRSRPARPRWTNDFFIQLHFTGVAFQKLIFTDLAPRRLLTKNINFGYRKQFYENQIFVPCCITPYYSIGVSHPLANRKQSKSSRTENKIRNHSGHPARKIASSYYFLP